MNILILGGGGREHAIAWKLKQSNAIGNLYVAPGNAGTHELAENIELSITDFNRISEVISKKDIKMLIVGPEAPLVEGIVDYFKGKKEYNDLLIIGPSKAGALLEGSKEYAKDFMIEFSIPTAKYRSFNKESVEEGQKFLETLSPPYVLKADGLAAGKGVLILDDLNKAKEELHHMLVGAKFGDASKNVVIEEFLEGIEMSVFALTDGTNYLILPEAKDYKRIGEGDQGLNTGGMGAVSPVPFADAPLMKKIEDRIIKPTVEGIGKRKIDYHGFLFVGLMIVNNEPFVIEYNVRMGDPESEVVMPRIKSDFLQHLKACAEGELQDEKIVFEEQAATTIMMVSGGYPEDYENGKEMTGFEHLADCLPFHAGTKILDGKIVTNGGRVIAVTAVGDNYREALAKAYSNVERILYDKRYYRKDIGFDLMDEV